MKMLNVAKLSRIFERATFYKRRPILDCTSDSVFSACPSSDLSAVLSDLPVLTPPACTPTTDTLPAPCRMVCCTDGSPGFDPACLFPGLLCLLPCSITETLG